MQWSRPGLRVQRQGRG
uniref:Uncharacterized protein n=1 Tax=Anguilla anguilla TaxID=7936 RepID=A0A0E9TKQ1_ANGAN